MINLSLFVKNNTTGTDKKFSLFSPDTIGQLDRVYFQDITVTAGNLTGQNKGAIIYNPYLLSGDLVTSQFVLFDLPVATLDGLADALNGLNIPADFSADNVNHLLKVGINADYANANSGTFIYMLTLFSSITVQPLSLVSAVVNNGSPDSVTITVNDSVINNSGYLVNMSTLFKIYANGVLVPIQDVYNAIDSNVFNLTRVAGVFASTDVITIDYTPANNPNNIFLDATYNSLDLYSDFSFTRMDPFTGHAVVNQAP